MLLGTKHCQTALSKINLKILDISETCIHCDHVIIASHVDHMYIYNYSQSDQEAIPFYILIHL